jgi:hypothetical protein
MLPSRESWVVLMWFDDANLVFDSRFPIIRADLEEVRLAGSYEALTAWSTEDVYAYHTRNLSRGRGMSARMRTGREKRREVAAVQALTFEEWQSAEREGTVWPDGRQRCVINIHDLHTKWPVCHSRLANHVHPVQAPSPTVGFLACTLAPASMHPSPPLLRLAPHLYPSPPAHPPHGTRPARPSSTPSCAHLPGLSPDFCWTLILQLPRYTASIRPALAKVGFPSVRARGTDASHGATDRFSSLEW